MTLRYKSLLIVLSTFSLLLGILYVALASILMQGFVRVEEQETREQVQQARDVLTDVGTKLGTTTGDWAGWDETYAFIQDKNPKYYSNLADAAIADIKTDVLVFARSSKEIVYATGFDTNRNKKTALPAGLLQYLKIHPSLLQHSSVTSVKVGIVRLPGNPMLLVSRPILTTRKTGPIRGTLVFGRLLDAQEVSRLSKLVGFPITLWKWDSASLPRDVADARASLREKPLVLPLSETSVAGYSSIFDYLGQPALLLRTQAPRPIYQQGKVSLRYVLLALLISGLMFSIVTPLLLQRLVLSRWTRLSTDLQNISKRADLSGRVGVIGTDELSAVASAVNQMLGALNQTQNQLQESEARFKAFMDHTPALAFIKDEAGRYVYINQTMEECLGWTRLQWENKTDFELRPPEIAAMIRETDLEVLRSGQAGEFYTSVPVADEPRDWLSYKFRIFNSKSEPFLAGMAVDVTQRKRAEEAVLQSQKFLQSTLDALTAHIAILDEQGIIIAVNAAWRRFAVSNGYTGDTFGVGDNYLHICLGASGVAEAQATGRGIRELIEGRCDHFTLEYPCPNPDEHSWFNLRATRFDTDGTTRVVVAHENITERKLIEESLSESEQSFRQIADNISEVFWVVDPRVHKLVYASSAFQNVWGRTVEELYANHTLWFDSIHPDDRERVRNAAFSRPAWEEYAEEFQIVRPDGGIRWINARGTPVRGEDGEIYRVVGIAEDITARKTSEAALQKAHDELEQRVAQRTTELAGVNEALQIAKEEAERANAVKSELLSRVSHELRTPMNAILGFGELLGMDELAPSQRESLDEMLKAGQHLLLLIDRVLTLSHIEQHGMRVATEPVCLRDVFQQTLPLVENAANGRGVVVSVAPDERELWALADAKMLQQALLHLLSNAINFNQPGGSVTLSCAIESSENSSPSRVCIEVRDTGRGVAAQHLPRLFHAFDRLDAEQTGVQGTGIGLTLSQSLVEAMGGAIGVRSIVGQGSTFWIELPLCSAPFAPGEGEAAPAPRSQAKVLYIEDNASNRRLLERIFSKRSDMKLLLATRGLEGLEIAVQEQPQLILLDLHLPDLRGDEVLRRLQEHPATQNIPVVIISADATTKQIERLRAAGADDYLTKPIDVSRLSSLLDGFLLQNGHELEHAQASQEKDVIPV